MSKNAAILIVAFLYGVLAMIALPDDWSYFVKGLCVGLGLCLTHVLLSLVRRWRTGSEA